MATSAQRAGSIAGHAQGDADAADAEAVIVGPAVVATSGSVGSGAGAGEGQGAASTTTSESQPRDSRGGTIDDRGATIGGAPIGCGATGPESAPIEAAWSAHIAKSRAAVITIVTSRPSLKPAETVRGSVFAVLRGWMVVGLAKDAFIGVPRDLRI
jgi:hypothetical protein